MIMKQSKIKVEKIDPESITVFGLPLRITPEIRDTTFRLSKTNPEKYAAIKKSIAAANGKLDEPIKVMKLGSETGDYYTIVDGHTRFEILMDLNILPPDANFVDVSKDVKCVADAQALAYRLNDLRRQAEIYQQAVNAIKANPTLSDRDIADICGIDHVSISRSRSIWTVSRETQNKTDTELTTIQEIVSEVESGTKGIKPVYEQFKVAVEVSNAILEINEPEFAKEMTTFWEAKKYTDKSAAKKLATMIAEHQVGKPDAYSTAIKPVMDKIVKLQETYSGVNSITMAGHKESVDNATNSVRTYLMNNINENITDILEGVRNVLIEELEQKREKDVAAIMKRLPEILTESKDHGYFLATLVLPKKVE